jgi:uncharacterized protein YeaO (DUF488 family)
MPIRVVQLGSPRQPGEGLRIGTVRRPPRGVAVADRARLNYFDVWLPELAPSEALLRRFQRLLQTPSAWKQFAGRYRREMAQPPAQRLLAVLAGLSQTTDFSVGCYCEDARRCHRSLLAELLTEQGGLLVE